jgi:hypothetical protein
MMSTDRELHQFDGKSKNRSTRHATEINAHAVPCSVCSETFYVDEATYDKVTTALEYDPSDNPFVCDDCEAEYTEEEHAQ